MAPLTAQTLIIRMLLEFSVTEECEYVKKVNSTQTIVAEKKYCTQVVCPVGEVCPSHSCTPDICVTTFVMHYTGIQPYDGPIRKIIDETISHCCWNLHYTTPELRHIHTPNISAVIEENMKEENSNLDCQVQEVEELRNGTKAQKCVAPALETPATTLMRL